jgi:hypothetical protein
VQGFARLIEEQPILMAAFGAALGAAVGPSSIALTDDGEKYGCYLGQEGGRATKAKACCCVRRLKP